MTPKEFREQFAKSRGYKSWDNNLEDLVQLGSHRHLLDEMMEEYKTGKWNCQ